MGLSSMKKELIEEKVANLLYQHGYNAERDDYVDIVKLIKKDGFSVVNALLPEAEDGFLAIRPVNDEYAKIIGVNANRPIEWKRFVIAQQYACSILHYENKKIILHHEIRMRKDAEENDTDYFAAALLMPCKSFKRVFERLKNVELSKHMIYLNLAVIYGVPIKKAKLRADHFF